MMEINILDFVAYIVLILIYIILLPDDFIEEINGSIGLAGAVIITIIWIILFVIIDYNVIDIIPHITDNIKITL